MKRIGILTSGGDSQGMNAAVRAIARSAMSAGLEAYGINYGFKGLVEGNIFKMNSKELDGISIVAGQFFIQLVSQNSPKKKFNFKGLNNLRSSGSML